MCTAITLKTKDHYFGRNLDLEYSYEESVVITPRNYPFPFRHGATISSHYAMIGTAYVVSDYPLYYEASNEKGLSMAGLNFPGEAIYKSFDSGKTNITPFELIPWILCQCQTVTDARLLLENLNLLSENFHDQLPLSPLHWLISDSTSSLVLEPLKEGLKIHDNPVGVLTNNPPFPYQLYYLNNYMGLSTQPPAQNFSNQLSWHTYSNGMGAIGLPGDWSSPSRFVRTAFVKMNSLCGDSEQESVNQFFHILDSAAHPRGSVILKNGLPEITQYSCCCNTDQGIYYYKTYENSQVRSVHMHKENLEQSALMVYPFLAAKD